jgi:hypothetical protein
MIGFCVHVFTLVRHCELLASVVSVGVLNWISCVHVALIINYQCIISLNDYEWFEML